MGNQCIGWDSREMDRDVWRWGIQDYKLWEAQNTRMEVLIVERIM
jgi:hypothetical protein